MSRLALLLVASVTLGCQALAGIDDRSVAPPLDDASDATIAETGSDTMVAPEDSTILDEGVVDIAASDTMSILPETSTDVSDTSETGSTARVVINEVKASAGDSVEIFNRSSVAIDIGGWGVTGTEDTGGFSTPVRFAAGTTLAPGAWLLILAGQPTRGGPETACGGPSSCYFTDWGISQSRGETLRVLRADDSIEDECVYPMNGHPDGKSYGRVPDGTGAFVITTPTPAAANKL